MNGKGIVYRFDIRDYWGYALIDTSAPDFTLFYGGSDDDLAFATSKLDLNGKPIKYASLAEMVHKLKPEVTRDDKFARLVWARILKGNAEGAVEGESLPPNVDPASVRYVEAAQLTYTLTRPDVYNAVMAIPGYSQELERELGVDKSKGMNGELMYRVPHRRDEPQQQRPQGLARRRRQSPAERPVRCGRLGE